MFAVQSRARYLSKHEQAKLPEQATQPRSEARTATDAAKPARQLMLPGPGLERRLTRRPAPRESTASHMRSLDVYTGGLRAYCRRVSYAHLATSACSPVLAIYERSAPCYLGLFAGLAGSLLAVLARHLTGVSAARQERFFVMALDLGRDFMLAIFMSVIPLNRRRKIFSVIPLNRRKSITV